MHETIEQLVPKPVSKVIDTQFQPSEEFFNSSIGINEAAKICKASKGQISRDSNKNLLPYTLDDKEQKRYKVSDLYEKYGFRNQSETSIKEEEKPKENIPDTTKTSSKKDIEIAVMQAKLQAKDETIRLMQDQINYLREKETTLIEQNNRFTMLLTSTKESDNQQAVKISWWKRLFL